MSHGAKWCISEISCSIFSLDFDPGEVYHMGISKKGVIGMAFCKHNQYWVLLVELTGERRAIFSVPTTTLIGFYDKNILLGQISHHFLTANVKMLFEGKAALELLGPTMGPLYTDLTCIDKTRRIMYNAWDGRIHEYFIDKRCDKILTRIPVHSAILPTLGIRIPDTKLLIKYNQNYLTAVHHDGSIHIFKGFSGIFFPSAANPQDLKSGLGTDGSLCSMGENVWVAPDVFHQWSTFVRIYQDIFICYSPKLRQMIIQRVTVL